MSSSTSPSQLLTGDAPLNFAFPRFTSTGIALKSTLKLFKDNPFCTLFVVWLVTSALSWVVTSSSGDGSELSLLTGLLVALTNVVLEAISTVIDLVIYLGIRAGEDEVLTAQPFLSRSFEAQR